ncbi:hypothetical protein H4582DRAFT_2064092 [Lactarius indigo]|nr:hypothetical protein H4582DRAFT_2064092 [Lactarius indigo]
MLIIFHHLYIPGSSESLVKRIGCAIASFAATIPFNTCHEDADGLQPSNQDITCKKCPPRRTPQIPTVTASPAHKLAATSTLRHRESTVTATPSQHHHNTACKPLFKPPQHRHIGNSVSVSGAVPTNTMSSPMAPLTTSGTSATRTSKGSSSCSSDATLAIRLAGSGAPVGFVTIVMGADGPIKVYSPSRFRISILSKSIFYRIFNLVSSCWWASWCYRYLLGARHRSLGMRKLGRLVFLTKFRNIIRLRATMSTTMATQDNNTGGVTTTTRRRL